MSDIELTVRQTQEAALEVLRTVTDLCERLSCRYFLAYGTLLGAIRHKGFIPWDDDVDIMMPRPDHDRLLAYFREHRDEYPQLRLFTYDDCPEYPYMITRFSDMRYKLVEENEKSYGMGVFIDIYPLDGLGSDLKEVYRRACRADILSSFCYQASRTRFVAETNTYGYKILKIIAKFPMYFIARLLGKDFFQKRLKALEYPEYDSSGYVGCGVWIVGYKEDTYKREWFDKLVKVPYEQYEFCVPAEYDTVLKHLYHDYMKLPPEKDRIGHHHYKTYRISKEDGNDLC